MALFWVREKTESFEQQVQALREFRDLGETFNYLGRTMIVTGHWDDHPEIRPWAVLKCDYADDSGVIRKIEFGPSELPGLIAQQSGENL